MKFRRRVPWERWPRNWVSLDPGGTTGYAVWDGTELVRVGQVDCGRDWRGVVEGVDVLLEELVGLGGLVVEDFLLRGGGVRTLGREGLLPVYVTGVLLGQLWREWFVILQGASDAISVIDDGRLERAVGGVVGAHARDAVRHGLLFMRKSGVYQQSLPSQ